MSVTASHLHTFRARLNRVLSMEAVHPKVINEQLWRLVQAAVPAVRAKIAEHIANGDYVSTARVPTISRFESGWPRTDRPLFGTKDAFEYSTLFSLDSRKGKSAYDDVPEFVAVINHILDDPALAQRLIVTPRDLDEPDPAELSMARIAAANIVLDTIDRIYALGAPDDPVTLHHVYSERERAFLASELTADIVAPLIMTNLDIDDTLDLGGGVRIERLDDAMIRAASRDRYSVDAVPASVSDAATHAMVIAGVKLYDTSESKRIWSRPTSPIVSLDPLDTAVEALRVVAEAPTGYAHVFLRPHDWADSWTWDLPAVSSIGTYRRYPAEFDNFGWLCPREVVTTQKLKQLPRVYTAMQQADPATKLAVRRLSLACLREIDDDKLVDACVGIEALLSNDAAEIAHKIATRGAAVLARHRRQPLNPEVTFRMFKTVYSRRSNLVHGSASHRHMRFEMAGGQWVGTVHLAAFLLRELLMCKLAGTTTWTIDSLDAEMLSAYLPAPEASRTEEESSTEQVYDENDDVDTDTGGRGE